MIYRRQYYLEIIGKRMAPRTVMRETIEGSSISCRAETGLAATIEL